MAGHGAPVTPGVPHIFDSAQRRARLRRAVQRQSRTGSAQWLLEALAADVTERLGFLRFESSRALVSGLGAEPVAGYLEKRGATVERALSTDFENPLPGAPYDLIVSLGELDTVNDLPGALIHLRHALLPGGLLVATMVGAGSLPVLRAAVLAADGERPAARIHPQIDSRAASGLLQRAGFTRQVADQYALTARYRSLGRLVEDLRDQALGSVLADRAPSLGRAARERAKAAFAAQAGEDGKTSERFEILTLTAWKD